MKQILRLSYLIGFFLLAGFSLSTEASVVDEVKTKSAQSDYENYYTLLQSYQGEKSGVTFESYSPAWKTVDQLKALEAELLKNKHGEELSYLGKIIILPDHPAGENVLGQYFANYEYTDSFVRLTPDRKIYLYGGNNFKTVPSLATTLSHEYGHHFSYYFLLNKENKKPGTWLTSKYVMERGLTAQQKVHDSDSGEYSWYLPEILAEDYVQLFGSETAIQQHAQMNVFLPTPFDQQGIQAYWNDMLGSSYTAKSTIPFYLRDYKQNPYNTNVYELEFSMKELQNRTTYVHAQDGDGKYAPILLDTLTNKSESWKWYQYNQLSADVNWVLNKANSEEILFTAIQHEETGFNRGTKTIHVNYENVKASVTTENEENQEKYKDTKVYSMAEKKQMIHAAALQYGIPPEVLKAIAFVETGMNQFDAEGNPIVTEDGGIGIMQITMSETELEQEGIDPERLKWNTSYNIEAGAKILKQKWNVSFLPKINEHNPTIIEDWYFAIMAYNGLSKVNDPNLEQEKLPYQERVLQVIRDYSLLPIAEIPPVKITYPNPDKPNIMSFVDESYTWPEIGTASTQMWELNETVYTLNGQLDYSRLRDGIEGIEIKKLMHYTPLKIVAGPFETTSNDRNQYVMYKVKGNGMEGYIASSNLRGGNVTLFKDVSSEEVASAVTYLQIRKIISGYPDGTFKPNDKLLRRHAAAMLVKELGLSLPEGYKMKATDMLPGQLGYNDMMIAEAHGLMGQGSDLRPNEYLTRSQMASILVRAYEKVYKKPNKNAGFTDIKEDYWNYPAINTLAYNKVTVTANGPFNPNNDVTRGQFSLFLKRTMDLK